MSIIKPKLSSIVPSQLPEFVREDHPTFIAFLQAYYEYTEQTLNTDLKTLRDIDTTLDSFIQYFKKEVADNIPFSRIDERFLISHLRDLYISKGSEASFKLLFRILFDKEVEVSYPATQILRASDGKWNQDVSIFVRVLNGNPNDIVGKLVDVVASHQIIRLLVNRRQEVEIEVDSVIRISEDIYEFYVDRRFFGSVLVGNSLIYKDIFNGVILSTTSKVEIQQGGKDFKVGELYNIRNGSGIGSILKITRVDSQGAIKSAQLIKYGVGYDSNFVSSFLAKSNIDNSSTGITNISINGTNIAFDESTLGFIETGAINRVDYNIDDPGVEPAFDGTYAGEILREFYVDSRDTQADITTVAVVKITVGALANYPGYYKNNDGFLNDAMYIQDSRYYQAFSYVLKIDERLDTYKSIIKTLIHPSGMALFGDYTIINTFDTDITLDFILNILGITLNDVVYISDTNGEGVNRTSPAFSFNKVLTEDSVSLTDLNEKLFTKSLTASTNNYDDDLDDNSITLSDSTALSFTKNVVDDNVTLEETEIIFELSKSLTEEILLEDLGAEFSFTKYLSDSATISESLNISVSKYITGDSISTEDTGRIEINPYAEGGYFAEDYVGTSITF